MVAHFLISMVLHKALHNNIGGVHENCFTEGILAFTKK